MKNHNVAIAGAAGNTGGELIRLLLNHPNVQLQQVISNSNAGNALSAVHQDLAGETDLRFTDRLSGEPDLLFLCFGHGAARQYLTENPPAKTTRIIDLSNDF